ncbi:hypothetical protein BO78DRAFT_472122 [Aspergillus sclerotiicarbonarius CBS 121057]|uniref:Mid2 domain-containing protein n=1 Tax=Aspergillus sclerotiicarbonarius (strain CBS 121057 / IBT 28362) TaxID=1448318 RepID=A0A319DZJ3_ASPSB|nr:hypothetical protein BO78DRAFT_472122 [Aspergillus sclerotiicarbonarius CBS 121057]
MTLPAILVAVTLILSATAMTTFTGTAAASTTSYLSLLDPSTNDTQFVNQGASIVSVDQGRNETTAILNCLSSELGLCSLTSPATVIMGPSTVAISFTSTFADTLTITTDSMVMYALETRLINCNITSSTQSARCLSTYEVWGSSGSITAASTSTYTHDMSAVAYQAIPITAGLDKLVVSATSTTTTTSTGTSTSTSTSSGQSGSSKSSSSKAWIAGPVIGALAGCALITAALYWWMRRRRRNRPPADGAQADPTDSIPYKAELPTDNIARQPDEMARVELPVSDVAELPVRDPRGLVELA